ncbi:MAG: L,D-transpeptidase [Eubacteriales bacterium]|nr:L,D-transpeptidase [Eubacteriales bacterium]
MKKSFKYFITCLLLICALMACTMSVSAAKKTKAAKKTVIDKSRLVDLKDPTNVHSTYFKATVKYDVKVKNITTKKYMTLKKGTQIITYLRKYSSPVKAVYKKNQKIEVSGKALRYTGYYYDSKVDYTREAKEKFINSRGYSSNTHYLIWVNHYTCKVNLFYGSKGNWKLRKTFPCVVGAYITPTPRGVYHVQTTTTNYSGSYGLRFTYSYRLMKGNWIHKRLGSPMSYPASHGCIRMNIPDLTYVYQHCGVGTTVLSH